MELPRRGHVFGESSLAAIARSHVIRVLGKMTVAEAAEQPNRLHQAWMCGGLLSTVFPTLRGLDVWWVVGAMRRRGAEQVKQNMCNSKPQS